MPEGTLRKRADALRDRYDRSLNEEIRSVIADTIDPDEERRAAQVVLANCTHDEQGVP